MAGRDRGTVQPKRERKQIRRRAFWRARFEAAADPCARFAVAADYLRVSLTRTSPADAERVSTAAAAELMRLADGLNQTGGPHDSRAA